MSYFRHPLASVGYGLIWPWLPCTGLGGFSYLTRTKVNVCGGPPESALPRNLLPGPPETALASTAHPSASSDRGTSAHVRLESWLWRTLFGASSGAVRPRWRLWRHRRLCALVGVLVAPPPLRPIGDLGGTTTFAPYLATLVAQPPLRPIGDLGGTTTFAP